ELGHQLGIGADFLGAQFVVAVGVEFAEHLLGALRGAALALLAAGCALYAFFIEFLELLLGQGLVAVLVILANHHLQLLLTLLPALRGLRALAGLRLRALT